MRGIPGAIDHVSVKNGEVCYHTIGNAEVRGLCGSGLLDLTAALLDTGFLSEAGLMQAPEYRISTSAVTLTQKDISEVQFAKSAIRSGIELLARADAGICRRYP